MWEFYYPTHPTPTDSCDVQTHITLSLICDCFPKGFCTKNVSRYISRILFGCLFCSENRPIACTGHKPRQERTISRDNLSPPYSWPLSPRDLLAFADFSFSSFFAFPPYRWYMCVCVTLILYVTEFWWNFQFCNSCSCCCSCCCASFCFCFIIMKIWNTVTASILKQDPKT